LDPTAHTSLAETAATLDSVFLTVLALGLGTVLHALPSQWVIRVCAVSERET
jgi:hypothetical protein